MSATLMPDPLFDRLAALTRPDPTADDMRARAAFWRKYAMDKPDALSVPTYGMVLDNCDAMLALARRMEEPAPVVALVPKRKAPKSAAIGAEQFWTLHSAAVRAMVDAHGLRWRLVAPRETIEVRLPPKLCSYVGPLGGRITWRRDHRMPAPKYWPTGKLPDGVEALPAGERYTGPMGDDYPSLVLNRLAVAEQIAVDRRLAWQKMVDEGADGWCFAAFPPMLTQGARVAESNKVDGDCWRHRVKMAQGEES